MNPKASTDPRMMCVVSALFAMIVCGAYVVCKGQAGATHAADMCHVVGGCDCEEASASDDGLKVYSVADPYNIDQNLLSHQTDINAFDAIPIDDVLMMIGDDGLYQYDYSNINNLVLLSVIPVN